MGFFGLRTPKEDEWKCEYCGISHTHRRDLHDIRSLPEIPDSFVTKMNWNPDCNCGMREALYAHNKGIIDLDDRSVRMFEHACVPEDVLDAIHRGTHPANLKPIF